MPIRSEDRKVIDYNRIQDAEQYCKECRRRMVLDISEGRIVFVCKNIGCGNYEIPFLSGYGRTTILGASLPMTKALYDYIAKLSKEQSIMRTEGSPETSRMNRSMGEPTSTGEKRAIGKQESFIMSEAVIAKETSELPAGRLTGEQIQRIFRGTGEEIDLSEKMIKEEMKRLRVIIAQRAQDSKGVSASLLRSNGSQAKRAPRIRTKMRAYLESSMSESQILAFAWREGREFQENLTCFGIEWGLDECDRCELTDECRETTFENEKHYVYHRQ